MLKHKVVHKITKYRSKYFKKAVYLCAWKFLHCTKGLGFLLFEKWFKYHYKRISILNFDSDKWGLITYLNYTILACFHVVKKRI